MFGQSSFKTTLNFPPAAAPGPPFPANSADNGLSVDGVTGRIVLGNDVGGVTAALLSDREIPIDAFAFMMTVAANPVLFIDGLNKQYGIGDFSDSATLALTDSTGVSALGDLNDVLTGPKLELDAVNSLARIFAGVNNFLLANTSNGFFGIGDLSAAFNGLNLTLIDAGSQARISNTAGALMDLDQANNLYRIGDIDGVNGNLLLALDDNTGIATIQTAIEQMLFLAPQAYTLGNVNDTLNGSKIAIDDLNDAFVFRSLARNRMISAEGLLQLYQFGDLDASGNNNFLMIDDSNQQIEFQQGGNRVFACDGVATVYQFGDVAGANNGSRLSIDDVTGIFDIANTANTAAVNINGVAGFTGTVAGPVSITVDGGIVTNVT